MRACILLGLLCAGGAFGANSAVISEILKKSNVYKQVVEDRQVIAHARFQKETSGRSFEVYASTLAGASPEYAMKILTQYDLYHRLVPLVEESQVGKDGLLELRGGAMGLTLHSFLKLKAVSDTRIEFSIVRGHFEGMKGFAQVEPYNERASLLYLTGKVDISDGSFFKEFLLQRAAEFALTLTGEKMRTYIQDSQKDRSDTHDPKVPQPRSSLHGSN